MLWGDQQVTQGTFAPSSYWETGEAPPAASGLNASDAPIPADPFQPVPLSQRASEEITSHSAQRPLSSPEDHNKTTRGPSPSASAVTTPRAAWGEEGELVQDGMSFASGRPNSAGGEWEGEGETERKRSRDQLVTLPGGAGNALAPLLDIDLGALRKEANLAFRVGIPGRSAFGRPSTQVPSYSRRGSR